MCECLLDTTDTTEADVRGFWAVCPTKDLLAASDGKRLRVHRFLGVSGGGFDTLLDALVSPQQQQQQQQHLQVRDRNRAAVTAIVWRPDGLVLAVGLSDGTSRSYSPESGASWATAPVAPIVDMKWVLRKDEESERAANLTSAAMRGDTATRGDDGASYPFVGGALDVLLCLDSTGCVAMWSSGQFNIGSVRVFPELPSSPSLVPEGMSVCWNGTGDSPPLILASAGVGERGERSLSVCCLDGATGRWAKWVSSLSVRLARARSCAVKSTAVVQTALARWRKAADLIAKRRGMLDQLLQDNAVHRDSEGDLLSFLLTGKPSPAMEQFLQTDRRLIAKPLESCVASAAHSLAVELPEALREYESHAVSCLALCKGTRAAAHFEAMCENARRTELARAAAAALMSDLRHLTSAQFAWLSILPSDVAEGLVRCYTADPSTSTLKWPDLETSRAIVRSIKETPLLAERLEAAWDTLSKPLQSIMDLIERASSEALCDEMPSSRVFQRSTPTCGKLKRFEFGVSTRCAMVTSGSEVVSVEVGGVDTSAVVSCGSAPKSLNELDGRWRALGKVSHSVSWAASASPTAAIPSMISVSFYRDGKYAVLHGIASGSKAVSVVGGDCSVVASTEVPCDAESIVVGPERGLCVVLCSSGRVLVYDLESSLA